MNRLNLSEWALRHRSLVTYFMLVIVVAGIGAYLRLGRSEDPDFTVKTMVVQAEWPGATVGDTLEQITDRIESKLQEIKIENILVGAGPMTLLADTKNLDDVEVNSLTADQDALAMMPGWVKPQSGAQPFTIRRLKLRNAKLSLTAIELPPFDGDVTMGPDGTVQRGVLNSAGTLRAELVPHQDKAWRASIEARSWRPPLGPAFTFEDLSVVAVVDSGKATLTSVEGRIGRGTVKGGAKASWGSEIRVDGEFSVANGDVSQLIAAYTRDFTMTGAVNTNGTFVLQGASLKNLFTSPRVEAAFTVEKGELNNVDIVRAVQSPARDGVRGGKTRFDSLGGSLQVSDKQYSYRRLRLNSGPMNATGNLDVASDGGLAGRISAELGSKSVVVARGNLAVAGNIKNPVLKP